MRSSASLRALAALACLFLAACGGGDDERLTVFAASSLTDVLTDIARAYEAETGQGIDVSFAASSAMREQILDGAPADVFVAANPAIVAELTQVGLITEPVDIIAANELVLVVPTEDAETAGDLAALAARDRLVGACATEVPCGQLTMQVLTDLGLVEEITVDTFEPNARATLAKVELGELDAAFVYRTDAMSSSDVYLVELPTTDVNTTAYVAGAVVGASASAAEFVSFLSSDSAQSLLSDAGFTR